MIAPEIKYDYKDKNTLRITFNFPAGIGSFSEDEDEIIKDFPELVKICKDADLEIVDAIQLTQDIDIAIYDSLGESINIDWRDDKVVEIHNINSLLELIKNLEDIATSF